MTIYTVLYIVKHTQLISQANNRPGTTTVTGLSLSGLSMILSDHFSKHLINHTIMILAFN